MPRIVFALLALLLLTSCASPQPAQPAIIPSPSVSPTPYPNALFVDPTQSLGPISPLVYGSNYGPWLVVPFDMLPAARAEAWLFDPDHQVENMGEVELGGEILFPAQSVTLFVLR